MVLGLHHLQLAMPRGRETDAEAFYADVLGLVRIKKPDHLKGRGGCWFACRGTDVQLHLGVEEPFAPAKKAHPALIVDDLDVVSKRLSEGGYEVVLDTQLEGYSRFYTADPFGNRVEIMSIAR